MYVAVKDADWPGANDVDEPEQAPVGLDNDWHVGPDARLPAGGCCVSVTCTPDRSTFPVFVTANVYVTVSPTADTDAGLADFTIDNAGLCVTGTDAVDGGDVTGGPVGGVPVAVAESLIDPLSRSACVTM